MCRHTLTSVNTYVYTWKMQPIKHGISHGKFIILTCKIFARRYNLTLFCSSQGGIYSCGCVSEMVSSIVCVGNQTPMSLIDQGRFCTLFLNCCSHITLPISRR